MSLLLRNPRLKPRQGARLNPTHWAGKPAACCLMNEGGGTPHDIGGWKPITQFGGPIWSPTGLNFNGTTNYLDLGAKLFNQFSAHEVTILGTVVPQATIKNSFVSFNDGATAFAFWLHENRTNPVPLGLTFWSTTTGWLQSLTNLVMGREYFVGWTIKGTTLTFYLNGQFDGSQTVTSFLLNNNHDLRIGTDGSGAFGKGLFKSVFIYNFAMSAAQVWQLYQRPYDMLLQRPPRRGFFGPGGVVVYSYSGSGGLVLGGGALVEEVGDPATIGGLVLSGSAAISEVGNAAPSGGLGLGGGALVADIGKPSSIGGLVLSGSSDGNSQFNESGIGGLLFAGAAGIFQIDGPASSGGLLLRGASGVSEIDNQPSSGGLVLGGSAGGGNQFSNSGTGGLAVGGTSAPAQAANEAASGSLLLAGLATATTRDNISATGGLALTGLAAIATAYNDSSVGGLVLGGVAVIGQFNAAKRVKPRLVTVSLLGPGFVRVVKRQR